MIIFSEKLCRIFLLVMNGIFITMGGSMVGLGIYQSITNPKIVDELEGSPGTSLTIVTGCIDMVIGICGLVGALLNKRILLMANAGMLSVTVLGNLATLIFYSVDLVKTRTAIRTSLKDVLIAQYGNYNDTEASELSNEVNDHHRKDNCCGWSGIDGENLYLRTPWNKSINVNVVGNPRTLPDSCCLKETTKCHATKDVKQARLDGLVYKMDCTDKIVGRLTVLVGLFLAQLSIVSIMQIACLAFSVIYLLQQPTT